MVWEPLVWLIFFAPLGSAVFIGFGIWPTLLGLRGLGTVRADSGEAASPANGSAPAAEHGLGRSSLAYLAAGLTILAVAVGFVLSLVMLGYTINSDGNVPYAPHQWLTVGDLDFTVGILMDPLTAIMLVVVTGISLMVQIYSVEYMEAEDDRGFARYFGFMSLFTASMVGLVLASNIIQLFVFWELVGLCSYLLIGFWFTRPAAAAAAKKAFIVTRIGDFGFLLAIMYLFFNNEAFAAQGLSSIDIRDIYEAVDKEIIAGAVATWIAAGILAGAIGKSGQFPLHTWLPDAMEGPTPVSALIHAATMVAAGVFLVARFFPVFEASETMMHILVLVGGFTALFAATMGLVMHDIKRVLAYSTISQLGYMMLALGTGAYAVAIFHLFTHAFFKALLFLGSGSVNHASGTFDMRYMGGLRKVMPWTYATFLIGSISLAGILPASGGWSKDEILSAAWAASGLVNSLGFFMALAAVFLTGFYIFRALFMTFEGDFRGGADEDPDNGPHIGRVHLAESSKVMTGPLVVLGAGALFIGFLVNPVVDLGVVPANWLSEFLGQGPGHLESVEAQHFNLGLTAVAMLIAISGIALAYLMYKSKTISPERLGAAVRPLHTLVYRKYYMDELYEGVITRRLFYGGIARGLDWIDKTVVDRIANGIGWLGANLGTALGQLQTGQLQEYGAAISIGILTMVGLYLWFL